MLDASKAAKELITAAGQRLGYDLKLEEIELLRKVVQPLFGNDIFVAGTEEIAAMEIPKDRSELREWNGLADRRYLHGAVQINLLARVRNIGEQRRTELQTVLALLFHAILA
jgi:hypothetical protein